MSSTGRWRVVIFLVSALVAACGKGQDDIPPEKLIFYVNRGGELCSLQLDRSQKSCFKLFPYGGQFEFSPDGLFLAFVGTDQQVHVFDTRTFEHSILTDEPRPKKTFRWSPDGSKIAFVTAFPEKNGDVDLSRDGTLVVLDVKSGAMRSLLEERAEIFSDLFWSRDGRRIFFETYDKVSDADWRENLMAFDLELQQASRVAERHIHTPDDLTELLGVDGFFCPQSNVSWSKQMVGYDRSADSLWDLFTRLGSLFLKNVKSGEERELVHYRWFDSKFNGGYVNPRWIDQLWVIALRPRMSTPLRIGFGHGIVLVDVEKGKVRWLVSGRSFGWYRPDKKVCDFN